MVEVADDVSAEEEFDVVEAVEDVPAEEDAEVVEVESVVLPTRTERLFSIEAISGGGVKFPLCMNIADVSVAVLFIGAMPPGGGGIFPP